MMYKNIKEMIEQIEKCKFKCKAGPLKSNTGWIELKNKLEQKKIIFLVNEEYDKSHSKWGLCINNPNPTAENYFPMDKNTAFRLKDRLNQLYSLPE